MPNRSASATPHAQLDLFAELEAEQHQARMDQAPTIFDLDQRGYFTRIAEAKLSDALELKAEHKVEIRTPQRGEVVYSAT